MEFKKLAIAETLSVLVGGGVGVYCALSGKGAWSLAYQLLGISATQTVCLWLLSKWKPKFILSGAAVKDIFHFSANLAGFNIVNYFARNVDYLLIGKFLGAEALGLYTLAYKLMLYPLQNISGVIGKVMFPAFSTIQKDIAKVREVYLKMIRAIAMVTFPMMFGLFAVAPEFIFSVYGPKWMSVVPVIRIFCICGLVQSIGTTVGNIYLSQGKANLQFRLQVLGTSIAAVAIGIGLQWGIVGVSLLYTTQAVVWVGANLIIMSKLINFSFYQINQQIARPIFLSIAMLCLIFALKRITIVSSSVALTTYVLAGIFSYLFFLTLSKDIVLRGRSLKVNF